MKAFKKNRYKNKTNKAQSHITKQIKQISIYTRINIHFKTNITMKEIDRLQKTYKITHIL